MSAYIRKTDGIYMYVFNLPTKNTNNNTADKKEIFTLYWINSIIRNNKCIFTKLNAVFILNTAV
jgi:hypothetical protein